MAHVPIYDPDEMQQLKDLLKYKVIPSLEGILKMVQDMIEREEKNHGND